MSRSLPVIIEDAVSSWDAMNTWFIPPSNDSSTETVLDEEFLQREIRKCILINHVRREEQIKE